MNLMMMLSSSPKKREALPEATHAELIEKEGSEMKAVLKERWMMIVKRMIKENNKNNLEKFKMTMMEMIVISD